MEQKKKSHSLTRKLAALLSVALVIQCVLFSLFISFGGITGQLRQSAMSILTERTQNRGHYLQNEMVQRWSNLNSTQYAIKKLVSNFLNQNGMTTEELTPDNPKTAQLLGQTVDPLVALLRRNSVTGAFVVFRGDCPLEGDNLRDTQHPGMYFRDRDPTTTPSDSSDILTERGPIDAIWGTQYPLDVNWYPHFLVSPFTDAYYVPQVEALHSDASSAADFGYWSQPFMLSGDDTQMITYTEPLLDSSGQPYGVLGIELSLEYLQSLMPSDELGDNASYLLAVSYPGDPEGSYRVQTSTGALARQRFPSGTLCTFDSQAVQGNIYPLQSDDGPEYYGSIYSLQLYGSATSFSQQQWVLIALMEKDTLFSFSNSVQRGVLGLSLALLALGILFSVIAGSSFAAPIRRLSKQVKGLDPTAPVALTPTRTVEIDELCAAIESLSRNVADSASRLSQIIEIAQIPLAAFHLDPQMNTAYCTKNLFPLLGYPTPEEPLSAKQFQDFFASLDRWAEDAPPDSNGVLYHLSPGTSNEKWLRCKTARSGVCTLGVFLDETHTIQEKRRIEYERDYDILTNLLNRRSFHARLNQLGSASKALGYGAMIMMDLDDLKHVNDNYGHDAGDEYIRRAGQLLRPYHEHQGIAARISGDEFYLFLYGFQDPDSLERIIAELKNQLSRAYIQLPGSQRYRLRASMGIAHYPQDSSDLPTLVRYADFAMYEAKHAVKGSARNFDSSTYQRDSYLLYNKEELNRVLEEKAIDYAFQPIVDCQTGRIFAYEALMRPRSETLHSPAELLRIAKAQSKLSQVEELTWRNAAASFFSQEGLDEEVNLFINSVPNQRLDEATRNSILQFLAQHTQRIVMELTESDEMAEELIAEKRRVADECGMRIALDDFGAGYSTDSVLLSTQPHYVKLDMSIVRGIDQDCKKQVLLRNLSQLCRSMGSKLVAEGIETPAELRTVIALGADYVQGYYLARPAFHLADDPEDIRQRVLQAHPDAPG